MSGKCDLCKRRVIWTETYANGKRMHVDPEPRSDGNLEILNAAFGPPISRVVTGEPVEGTLRYVSHFATCPTLLRKRARKSGGARRGRR